MTEIYFSGSLQVMLQAILCHVHLSTRTELVFVFQMFLEISIELEFIERLVANIADILLLNHHAIVESNHLRAEQIIYFTLRLLCISHQWSVKIIEFDKIFYDVNAI